MRVTVDANVPTTVSTNQDEIYVVAADECHLWEDPDAPVFIRAEQAAAATLGVLLVIYGYFAYSFRRYTNGVGRIVGTGRPPRRSERGSRTGAAGALAPIPTPEWNGWRVGACD